jgi:hypothetical protein
MEVCVPLKIYKQISESVPTLAFLQISKAHIYFLCSPVKLNIDEI